MDGNYYFVSISMNGKVKKCTVHSLVANAFLGDNPNGLYVLHGVKGALCNEISNLRYGTAKENSIEMIQ